jgi:hypothetical protein
VIFRFYGTILGANQPAAAVFEADSTQKMVGKSIYSLGKIEAQLVPEGIWDLKLGKTIRFELACPRLPGNVRRIELINIPLLGSDGEVDRIIGFANDLTAAQSRAAARTASRYNRIVRRGDRQPFAGSQDYELEPRRGEAHWLRQR